MDLPDESIDTLSVQIAKNCYFLCDECNSDECSFHYIVDRHSKSKTFIKFCDNCDCMRIIY